MHKFRNRKQVCCTCQRAYKLRMLLCRQSRSEHESQDSKQFVVMRVMWGCVYVNLSPLIPNLVTTAFSSPITSLLSKGTGLQIVESCRSPLTYQTEVLILSAADQLIRFYPQEEPGCGMPQASHAWRTQELFLHRGGSDAGLKHTWSHRLSMATGLLVRPDKDNPLLGRGLSHDKGVFF